MYMVLIWKDDGNFLTHLKNKDGGIKLFDTVPQAEFFMVGHNLSNEEIRIISVDEVKGEVPEEGG